MQTLSCKICGKLFNYMGGMKLCQACTNKMEDKFHEVKEYIYENKNATMQDVSKACEVPTQQIQRWIRDERLAFSDDSPLCIQCESCGANIKTGRYCSNCKKKLEDGLSGLYQPPKTEKKKTKRDGDKMRFLGKDN